MLESLLRTVVKVAIASLIVGTILAHFGITIEAVVSEFGFSPARMIEVARQTLEWALPNMLLGAMIIVPVWVLVYLFRPPRREDSE